MGFIKGKKPPQTGEKLSDEQSSDVLSDVITKMKEVSQNIEQTVSNNSINDIETSNDDLINDVKKETAIQLQSKDYPSIPKHSNDFATTYKGVKAIKRVITQIIINNQVAIEEIEDKPINANITVD